MARGGLSIPKIIGIVVLAAGVVVLVIGIYQFVEFRQSVGGKLARGANQLFGSSKVAKGYTQPIILIISGVVAAAAGFFVNKKS
jgi:hypothetical protein